MRDGQVAFQQCPQEASVLGPYAENGTNTMVVKKIQVLTLLASFKGSQLKITPFRSNIHLCPIAYHFSAWTCSSPSNTAQIADRRDHDSTRGLA